MRILIVIALSVFGLMSQAMAASPPQVVTAGVVQIRSSPGVGNIPIGTGVVMQAGDPGDGSVYVAPPSGADSTQLYCVVYRFIANETSQTPCIRVGSGPAQILLGASGAAKNTPLRVSGTAGTWEVATSGSLGAYYQTWGDVSGAPCVANSLCWGFPVGHRPVASSSLGRARRIRAVSLQHHGAVST